MGLEVAFNGITVSVSGEAVIERDRDDKEGFSVGGETTLGPYPLIKYLPIFEGKVYPFQKDE